MSRFHSVPLCTALLLYAAAAMAWTPASLESRVLPSPAAPGPAELSYIKVPAGSIALTHVRVIDGTGQPVQVERTITDIENVELVFKDGVGYDPAALLQSVRGRYGEY